jgi:hypothetical protein
MEKRHGQCEENRICVVCGSRICRWCSRNYRSALGIACEEHSKREILDATHKMIEAVFRPAAG